MPVKWIVRRMWRFLEQIRQGLDPSARRQEARFRSLSERFYNELWAGAARSSGAEIEPVGWGFQRIRRGDRWTMVRGAEVMLDDRLRLAIAGNKLLTNRLLAEWGLRVARHRPYDLTSVGGAKTFLKEVRGPAVVKPARQGGAGKGVTTGITTPARLRRASRSAARIAWDLMIEEQVPGASFRLLVLGGRVVDAIRRDPPLVVGDGRTTIRRLLEQETARRLEAQEVRALHPLTLDLEGRLHLEDQGLTPETVCPAGRAIRVKSVVNQNASSENHSLRGKLDPSVVALVEGLVEWLGIELAGVDLISPDLSVPLEASHGLVSEVNTTPGLHHHYLIAERDRVVPVAELLLDRLLSDGAARSAGVEVRAAGARS